MTAFDPRSSNSRSRNVAFRSENVIPSGMDDMHAKNTNGESESASNDTEHGSSDLWLEGLIVYHEDGPDGLRLSEAGLELDLAPLKGQFPDLCDKLMARRNGEGVELTPAELEAIANLPHGDASLLMREVFGTVEAAREYRTVSESSDIVSFKAVGLGREVETSREVEPGSSYAGNSHAIAREYEPLMLEHATFGGPKTFRKREDDL